MRNTIIFAAFLTVLAMAVFGCSSSDDPVAPADPEPLALDGSLGASGGTLTSSGGNMTLTVPAGVLAGDTEIAITEVPPADTGTALDGLDVVMAFEFTPAGLDLGPDSEWTVTVPWTSTKAKVGELRREVLPLAVISRIQAEDIIRSLPEQLASLDIQPGTSGTTTVKIRGVTTGYAGLITLDQTGGSGEKVGFGGEIGFPGTSVEGEAFEISEQVLVSRGVDLSDIAPLYGADAIDGVLNLIADNDPVTPISNGTLEDGSTIANYQIGFEASIVGTYRLSNSLTFGYEIDPEVLEPLPDFAPPVGPFSARLTYETGPITITPEEDPGGPLLEGVYDVATTFPEHFSRPIRAKWSLRDSWIGAGSNGATFYSVSPKAMFQVSSTALQHAAGSRYGAVATVSVPYEFGGRNETGAKDAGDDQIGIITYGSTGGTITQWFPENNSFGFTQLFAMNINVTDVTLLGGDPYTGGFVYVNNTSGYFYVADYDTTQDFFATTGPYSSFPGASGNAVSAWAREEGSAVIVTDGTPGSLYLHDLSGINADAVAIGSVGNGPRRVRVLGNIGVVSNFSSGSLTVFTWDEADNVTISDTVNVGDGPIGIDLVSLAGGQVAVVSTGFNDDTWSVTVLGQDGMMVSNTSYDLPSGATGPGHATWVDDEGQQVVISCNTSQNVLVADSGL